MNNESWFNSRHQWFNSRHPWFNSRQPCHTSGSITATSGSDTATGGSITATSGSDTALIFTSLHLSLPSFTSRHAAGEKEVRKVAPLKERKTAWY
jgi:hypothetical protein